MSEQRVFIPFRDTGDAHLRANLDVVTAWWYIHGYEPTLVDDGLAEGERFNRFRAMNRAVEKFPETEVFIFCDADTIVEIEGLEMAVQRAKGHSAFVIPFGIYSSLSAETTEYLREVYADETSETLTRWWSLPSEDLRSVFRMHTEHLNEDAQDVGAAYVIHRSVIEETGGFPETITGTEMAHSLLIAGVQTLITHDRTNGVSGAWALRMWHPPRWAPEHRTEEDKAADAHDRNTLIALRADAYIEGKPAVVRLFSTRVPSTR